MVLLICLLVFLVVLLLWMSHCSDRALRERFALIDFVFSHRGEEWRVLNCFFNLVTYDHHVWRLVFFRNPKYLYHYSLWKGFPNERKRS
jgi:hypothetical protein